MKKWLKEEHIFCKKYHATYKYVECYLDDFDEVNVRLKNRDRMISQIEEIKSIEGFRYTIENSKKPSNFKCLTVNTGQPIDDYIQSVIDYIKEGTS
jgi:hypothetical protein